MNTISVETIGSIAVEGGWDTYLRITESNKDPLDLPKLKEDLRERNCYSGTGTGIFCDHLCVLPDPDRDHSAVAILLYRYDA